MGQQDDISRGLTRGWLWLQYRPNRDLPLRDNPRHVGQHTGLIGHGHAQVVPTLNFANRQHGKVGQRIGLEGQMGHPMIGVGRQGSGDIDEVGNHRAGGRLGTGAFAIKHGVANRIAMNPDCVHRAFNAGQ